MTWAGMRKRHMSRLLTVGLAVLVAALPAISTAAPWKFIAVSDSQGLSLAGQINSNLLAEIAIAITNEMPDLVIFHGDLVYSGTEDSYRAWTNIMAPVYNAGIPVRPVRGNHDGDTATYATAAGWTNVFAALLPTNGPAGETGCTYSFTNKNALFIALDQYIAGQDHRINQAWLDAQLVSNSLPHVFVYGHEPAFKVYNDNFKTLAYYPSNRDTFWNSLAAAGVKVYFTGHEHLYDHARIDDGDGDTTNDLHQCTVGTAVPVSKLDPFFAYDGNNSSWTPVNEYRQSSNGYVVGEVDGINVTLTWKSRVAANTFLQTNVFSYIAPLMVSLPSETTEGAGTLVGAGNVILTAVAASDVTVTLTSSLPAEVWVTNTVTVPMGATNATFDLIIEDDARMNGTRNVSITAAAAGYSRRTRTMSVLDNVIHHYEFMPISSPQTAAAPFSVVITARDVSGTRINDYTGRAELTAHGDRESDSMIPVDTDRFVTGLWASAVTVYDADTNIRLIVNDGAGHVGTSVAFTVTAAVLDHFTWGSVPSPQYVGTPFAVTVVALDAVSNILNQFTDTVPLTAWISPQTTQLIFNADFESDMDSFVISNDFAAGNGLWHRTTARGADAGHTSSNSLYYGQDENPTGSGNYNTGNSRNEGILLSPVLDLTEVFPPVTLSFNYRLETETSGLYDIAGIDVSADGSPFTNIAGNKQSVTILPDSPGGTWCAASVNLSAYTNSRIRLRFHFDTGDNLNNDYEGWYVDDVTVKAATRPLQMSITPTGSDNFINGTWTGTVTALSEGSNIFLRANVGGRSGDSNPFDVRAGNSVAVDTGPGGKVSPNDTVLVIHGQDVSFNIDADQFYHIADILTNNVSVGGPFDFSSTNFLWNQVVDDGTLKALFHANMAANDTPHWWLAGYGLDTNAAGAMWDDGDPMPAWQEYIAGTDPTNPLSYFQATADTVVPSSSNLVIRWNSASNRFYSVLFKTNLLDNDWQPLTSGLPAGLTWNVYTDSIPSANSPKFYLIGVTNAP